MATKKGGKKTPTSGTKKPKGGKKTGTSGTKRPAAKK